MTPTAYVEQVKAALAPLADPVAAGQMRAYLRDQFPFLGLPAPVRRQAVKALPPAAWGDAELLAAAALLWNLPEREYRYTAIDLLRRQAKYLSLSNLPDLLALVQREPWWETVDGLAGVIGAVVFNSRKTSPDAQLAMDALLGHDCLWVRRVAMIHQLGWRLETDARRLFAYAGTLAPESDFFIRKAIGWALRDFAKWNPAAVGEFIEARRPLFSGLTIREATKHLR